MVASPLWVSEELEYWDTSMKFSHMAATHSELVAVSTTGHLHQWRWADAHPYQKTDVSSNYCNKKKNMTTTKKKQLLSVKGTKVKVNKKNALTS